MLHGVTPPQLTEQETQGEARRWGGGTESVKKKEEAEMDGRMSMGGFRLQSLQFWKGSSTSKSMDMSDSLNAFFTFPDVIIFKRKKAVVCANYHGSV